MEYHQLADLYSLLEKTTKRLEKTTLIANFLKTVSSGELPAVIYLLQGKIFPQWDERKIGFSMRLMIKAIATATGENAQAIERSWNETGDLGDAAEVLLGKKTQQTLYAETLTVKKVSENIRKLATLEGAGTVNRKVGLVAELLSNAKAAEARFIVRTILEVLRIGIAEGVIRDSIAEAFDCDNKEVERAFELIVDYGEVAKLAKTKKLDSIALAPGRPLRLMLAVLTKSVEEGFERVGSPAALEYKYDGFRLQVHKSKDEVTLYTRSMENVTKQFPDVVQHVQEHINSNDCILDCEAVGYSPETKKYLPFQIVSQRIRRKYNISKIAKKFPVELNIFDILYHNKKNLFNMPFKERRALLETVVQEKKQAVTLSTLITTDNEKEATAFFQQALKEGHEGIMFKSLAALYKPGRYVGYMAKFKEVMETLDLVIVKAEWGEGKRATYLSSFTLACKEGDTFVMVGKAGTGLKEKSDKNELTFKEITEALKPLILKEEGKSVELKATFIVEVAYEEIQQSPTYNSGYALRFPRILRARNDKNVHEIATRSEIETLYKSQNK